MYDRFYKVCFSEKIVVSLMWWHFCIFPSDLLSLRTLFFCFWFIDGWLFLIKTCIMKTFGIWFFNYYLKRFMESFGTFRKFVIYLWIAFQKKLYQWKEWRLSLVNAYSASLFSLDAYGIRMFQCGNFRPILMFSISQEATLPS